MADTTQPVLEFVQNLLSDIDSGAITAQEALVASNQYAYLRDLLAAQSEQFSQAELINDEAFVSAVRGTFQQALDQLTRLANFQQQQPDRPMDEQHVRSIATLRTSAFARIKEETENKLVPYRERRRAFIHELVEKFSSTLPAGAPTEQSLAPAVDQALYVAAGQATSAQTKDRFTEQLIAQANVAGTNAQALKSAIADTVGKNDDYIAAVVDVARSQKEMYGVLFTNQNVTRPDVVADVLLSHPANESRAQTETRALKLAGAAAGLEMIEKPFSTPNAFFRVEGIKGVSAGAQAAAGGVLALVGEPAREMLIKEKVGGSLRAMFANTQTMVDRLGENFVQSNVFAQMTQRINQSLGDKTVSSQARNVVDDVFSSIFRGPFSKTASSVSKERIFTFYELARANAHAPKGFEFLPKGALPWNIYSPDLGGVFGGSRANNRAGGTNRSWLSALGIGTGLSAMGSRVGNMAASGFDQALSFFMSNPRFSTELSRSRRAAAVPTPIWVDPAGLVALVVVVALLLLFILPSPLNGSLINYSAKVSGLLASLSTLEDQINETAADVTSFKCDWTGPTPPASTISTCPVQGGVITQGPFNAGGSHATLNAYDFAGNGLSQGSPIRAAHDAYVVSFTNSYAPNQFAKLSYGNNVVLVGTNPTSKQQFCTNYAHLLDVAPEVVSDAGTPTLVKAGTIIGYLDTTGYVYGNPGTHLHFGYKGADPRAAFLPPSCP